MLHACSANVSTFPIAQAQMGSLRNSQTKVNNSLLQTTRHPVQFCDLSHAVEPVVRESETE